MKDLVWVENVPKTAAVRVKPETGEPFSIYTALFTYMVLFGLHEAAVIALIGVTMLLYPRVVPYAARRIGAWRGTRKQVDETPAETAAHVYDTVSPVVDATGRQKETVFLQQVSRFLRER